MLSGKEVSCGTESCVCLWQPLGTARSREGQGRDVSRANVHQHELVHRCSARSRSLMFNTFVQAMCSCSCSAAGGLLPQREQINCSPMLPEIWHESKIRAGQSIFKPPALGGVCPRYLHFGICRCSVICIK